MKSPSPNSSKPPAPDTPMFTLGDVVRRKYAAEGTGMITGVTYRLGGGVEFLVSWSDETEEHVHYAEELKLDPGFEG